MGKLSDEVLNDPKVKVCSLAMDATRAKVQAIDARINELVARGRKPEEKEAAIERFLSGGNSQSEDSVRQELGTLYEQRRIGYQALERVERDYYETLAEVAGKVAVRHKPAHRETVRKILHHLVEIGKLNLEERADRDELEGTGAGVQAFLPYMGCTAVGDLKDNWRTAYHYLQEAVMIGYVSEKEAAKMEAEHEGL
jgi:hypothetical protein